MATTLPGNDVRAERLAGEAVPSRADAARFARDHTVVPVYRELPADSVTPVAAFARLCAQHDTGFLLESLPVGGGAVGYSYVGHRPTPMKLPDGHNPLRVPAGPRVLRRCP